MPNIKNNKSKFVKNLMLVAVSTTMLSGVTLEAIAVDGGPPPPPPPPPPLAPAPVIAGGHDAIFDQIRQGKALKKAQAVAHQQGQPVNQNLARLKKTGVSFDANGNFIIPTKTIVEYKNLTPAELLEKQLHIAEEKKKLEEQKQKIEENKKKAKAYWDDPVNKARREAEERKTNEIVAKREKEERDKIAEEGKRKRAAENGNNIGAGNGNNTDNSHYQMLISSLRQEKLDLLQRIHLLQEQLNNSGNGNNGTDTTIIVNNNENGIGSGNGNYSFEQEEIARLNDEISSLKALSGEKQRNEEFLDVIEFLKQYVSEGGSIQETIGFLEEQRKKGLSLSEAIDFLEEKESMEAMLELQEQEKAIDAQLEQKAEEKITDAEGTLSATSSITTGMMDSVTDLIKSRISGISGLAAVAAGDEDTSITKGVWIAGLYGVNKQGTQKNMSGYKGNTYGSTIGFDVEFNDNDILGIAYTNMHSNFKTSTTTKGKTAVNSHVLALYGQKELPENFSLQGMFAAARNYIKNKSVYSGSNVIGKYKNDSLSFETLLNYKYPTNYELTIIPNIGIRYGSSKDGIYKDSDLGVQHLTVAAKSQNLWTGIVGTKILFTPQRVAESITLTPGLHVSIENHFNNKNKKVEAQVSWEGRQIKETIILPKQPKTGYNIGASVLAEKGNINLLLEYNCHLQKKYQSHQGFVKLKISF